ncbi:MAG: hypothetical protein GX102_03595 [Porphyromonadaceae bacterium]|jgi:pilus assembly protein TadC|nr:hypothetical protein [Porphyromonadaceae bacterium]
MTKLFEKITELIGWLQIMASPFFIGLLIGSIVYFPNQTTTTLIIGLIISLVGLVIGIILATKIYKSKNGTIWFLSRTIATPELDKKDEKI